MSQHPIHEMVAFYQGAVVTVWVRVETAPFHLLQACHFSKRRAPVGFQIQMRDVKLREKIFFHMPPFEDHQVASLGAKAIVQGLHGGSQERMRVGLGGGGRLKGETVNVSHDPLRGDSVFCR